MVNTLKKRKPKAGAKKKPKVVRLYIVPLNLRLRRPECELDCYYAIESS